MHKTSRRGTGGSEGDDRRFVPRPRRRTRTYRLIVRVPPLDAHAWDVIHSIEQRTIQVADPHNRSALDDTFDASGAFLIDSDATLAVPLDDWLAVGCQRIRWARPEDKLPKGACGVYRLNSTEVFGLPHAETPPHGPGAAVCEIILPQEIQGAWFACQAEQDPQAVTRFERAFQLVVAHELVHAFQQLRYLVPAFMDWPSFWRNVLDEGCRVDCLLSRVQGSSTFLDDYGGPNELAMIQTWWPSRAEIWFEARRWFSMFGL